jgi:hypothetical protein
MTSQELSGIVFVLGYLGLLVGAVKIFGIRRVLWFFAGIVVLGVAVAFKSLGAITSSGRRY